jgi:flagellar biosynthetic protein FlhB
MAGSEESDQDDKTEAPTQRRLERARAEGQVPVSAELAGFAGLLGAALALAFVAPGAVRALSDRLAAWLHAPALGSRAATDLLAETAWPALLLLLAVAGLVAAPSLLAHLLQTGLLVSAAQLRPQWARISPLAGLKRLVSVEALVNFLKALFKLGVLGLVVWHVLAGDLATLKQAVDWPVEGLLAAAMAPFLRVLGAVLAALAVLSVLDILFTRLRFTRQMRMSRQDLRQEHKDSEGDPHLKAKLKRLRAERSRQRMMADVKTAAVVITNPTHYAVALAYDREKDAAPRVVAKGSDAVAARIRAEAEKHHVPLYANPPLARALFTVDLGQAVPPDQYQAVAEVIAYIWKLKSRAAGAAARG